ncbi:MAG: prepilin-type N-terminal cleavage/methylation domain-containing protein [Defluviitaleaceae bacterium]|nr:prepilin-type N-terminal cleavage/methylation domain-containing protein [Defluviitaleaceae bacterium]
MKNKKRAGVTLLELILAISVLLIIIVPLGNIFLASNRINAFAQDVTIASLTAQMFVEENIGLTIGELEARFYPFLTIAPDPSKNNIELMDGVIEKEWNGFLIEGIYTQRYYNDPVIGYIARPLVDLVVNVRANAEGSILAQHQVVLNTGHRGL